MDIKSLMIGDWVTYTYKYMSNTLLCEVVAINNPFGEVILRNLQSDKIDEFGNKDYKVITTRYEDVYPIPLTPEILEKNGFVKNNNGYGYTYSYHRNYPHLPPFEIYECFDGWGANVIGYGIEISGSTEDIDSVHILQHTLHLCGLDKLANNLQI